MANIPNIGGPGAGGNGGGQQPPQMRVNVNDLQDITCDECGCRQFQQIHFIKKLSKLNSPNGQEQLVPVPSFACKDCGHVNDEFKSFD